MKRNRWLKIATLFTALLLVLTLLAACGGKESKDPDPAPPVTEGSGEENGEQESDVYEENGLPKNEKVTLKMGFFEAGMGREYIDYAIDTFKEKFPNVDFDVTYSPTLQQIVGTKISANNDDDMFDMFNSAIPGGPTPLVENGMLESQEDLWDRVPYDGDAPLKDITLDGTYDTAGRILGETYNLPFAGTAAGLFFDKTLFEDKGWNQNPNTWAEFIELLEEIKADGIIPITYTGVHNYYIDNAFGNWKLFELADHSGNLEQFEKNFRSYTLPQYLAPENIERWNRIYELGQKGFFPDGVAALDHTQSQMQILQGRAALVSTASWVENEMADSTPEGFRWGFMVVPFGDSPDDTKWSRLTAGSGFYIWAGRPELNKQWAKEFNLWMLNLDVQGMIGEKAGQLPLRKDFFDEPELADKLQPLLKEVLEYYSTNNVRGDSGYRDVTLTDPAFQQAQKVLTEAITEITLGKQDPLPILEQAEALLEKAIQAQE